MSSGVLGRGTYQRVISGRPATTIRHRYYPQALEQVYLLEVTKNVRHQFLIRDKIWDNRMPDASFVNGHFALTPIDRQNQHYDKVMPAIRERSLLLERLAQQRAINDALEAEAKAQKRPSPKEQFRSPDADAYFRPWNFKGANNWPNFHQHDQYKHVVPKPMWRRHAELGGITRVHDRMMPLTTHMS
eukprot:PhM_4_TR13512/c0_g1_i1/m.79548